MKPIAQVINLIPDGSQHLWSGDLAAARRALLAADPAAILAITGSFALVAKDGERVVLARSLDRPLRYFLAKATDGPVLIVAERIDEIATELGRHGWADQFHHFVCHEPASTGDGAESDEVRHPVRQLCPTGEPTAGLPPGVTTPAGRTN